MELGFGRADGKTSPPVLATRQQAVEIIDQRVRPLVEALRGADRLIKRLSSDSSTYPPELVAIFRAIDSAAPGDVESDKSPQ